MKTRTVAYWLTTIFGPASFVIGGYLNLTRDPQVMATMAHLGYPPYFAAIVGFWKLAGAIAIAVPGVPRTVKEWAYAGFFFDLTGAAATRAFAGDGVGDIVAPLVFLALVLASRALQPGLAPRLRSGAEDAARATVLAAVAAPVFTQKALLLRR